jgi:hypothetical protein
MGKWRVYLNPFDDEGIYTGFQEITEDVISDKLGSINSDLDNTDYDIGVYRTSNFKITLRNDHARYSDVDNPESIFRYTRSNSLLKITWEISESGPFVGIAESESGYLSEEQTVFTGFINDDSLVMDLESQSVSFTCLGKEYLFQRTIVPFGTISNGDLFSFILYNILNQDAITEHLTVLPENIVCGVDLPIDSIASLQNKTVQEGLNNLLLASNSVLYLENETLYITPREPTLETVLQFFGQSSTEGNENILNIRSIKNGMNRLFNYFTWKDATVFSQNVSSVTRYGARKKEIDFEFILDDGKRQVILDALVAEFGDPKQEFDLDASLDYTTLTGFLLDRVAIDYPIRYVDIGDPLPICGNALAGEAILPKPLSAFSIPFSDSFKIIGRSIDPQYSQIKFKMRSV